MKIRGAYFYALKEALLPLPCFIQELLFRISLYCTKAFKYPFLLRPILTFAGIKNNYGSN